VTSRRRHRRGRESVYASTRLVRRFRDGVGATQGVKLTMEACCIMFSVKPEMEKNPDGACAVSLVSLSMSRPFGP
jgi:CBS-domain-containing membrane protein